MKDFIAITLAVISLTLMVVLCFEEPESATALCLLAIAVFKGMERR